MTSEVGDPSSSPCAAGEEVDFRSWDRCAELQRWRPPGAAIQAARLAGGEPGLAEPFFPCGLGLESAWPTILNPTRCPLVGSREAEGRAPASDAGFYRSCGILAPDRLLFKTDQSPGQGRWCTLCRRGTRGGEAVGEPRMRFPEPPPPTPGLPTRGQAISHTL